MVTGVNPVDFLAGLPHYADHLLPVWWALPPELRGEFYVGRLAAERVASEGVQAIQGRPLGTHRLTVVAAFSDMLALGRRPSVMVEHGAGQSYDGDPASVADASYSGGRERGRVELFLCPNERVASRNRAAYPNARVELVGSPRLDPWWLPTRALVPGRKTAVAAGQTVAFSFHWDCRLVPETRSAWPHYAEELIQVVRELKAEGVTVLGHGHPRLWDRIGPWWDRIGAIPVQDFTEVLDRADVYVADNTSTLYEFAALDRPVVVMNAPWYRRDVDHGLRFWTHSRLGIMVDNGWELTPAIHKALTDPPEVAGLRRAITRAVYPALDGQASARAAAAIIDTAAAIDGDLHEGTSMGNPKAPRQRRVERRETFPEGRLRRLGATDTDVALARENWAGMNPQEQEEALHALGLLSDEELAAAILEAREDEADDQDEEEPSEEVQQQLVEGLAQWADDAVAAGLYADVAAALGDLRSLTVDEAQEAIANAGRVDSEALGAMIDPTVIEDARGRMDQPPSRVLRWVGDDKGRAAAVVTLEQQGAQRAAVIDGARAVLDADAPGS
jgi:hypothetical protein